MILKIEITRYFTCDEGHECEFGMTFTGKPRDLAKTVTKAAEMPAPELPDLGSAWRAMTDEEITDYQARKEQEEKRQRRIDRGYDDEDDGQ